MKTLVYKGFGMDSDESLFFEISISKEDPNNQVIVKVRATDQFIRFVEDESENEGRFDCTSGVYFDGKENQYKICYANYSGSYDNITWESDKEMSFEVDFKRYISIKEAVSWIKNTVSERRNYWKTRKGEYNRLVAELRELTVEDFLDEECTSDEITISHTVKRRK